VPFAISHLLMAVVTAVMAAVRGQSPLEIWNQWDTTWYLGIAAHGYHWGINGKSALAFFPLYPLLIHVGSLGGSPSLAFAMLAANLAGGGALMYLYLWTSADRGAEVARRTVWLFALFPTAVFTIAPYTESLFLLCAIGSMYHARRQQSLLAGLWMAGAIMTRSTGFILVPALILAVRPQRVRTWSALVMPTCAAAGGYLTYLAVLGFNPVHVLGSQRGWHRTLTFPWTGFTASLHWLIHHGSYLPWTSENLLQMGTVLFFLFLTVRAWKEIDASSAVYCLGFWLIVLCTPEWQDGFYAPFMSTDRFVLALFPIVAWGATKLVGRRYRMVLVASATSMVVAATVHLAGGWVG